MVFLNRILRYKAPLSVIPVSVCDVIDSLVTLDETSCILYNIFKYITELSQRLGLNATFTAQRRNTATDVS